jgi:hypothetical protein
MDAITAFLQGETDDEIHVELPGGYRTAGYYLGVPCIASNSLRVSGKRKSALNWPNLDNFCKTNMVLVFRTCSKDFHKFISSLDVAEKIGIYYAFECVRVN